ncbi:hypothetical protein GO755_20485 [Spirosoma sp. HMF4905]|uniref:Uncharacterized protein n=1 Tax=Spirosoma arboris TaxID=2682092 RepID=A0A7K1SF46_9BACT|nr:hypothetical protein [Spirosoma arboris]MVM32435.1 hypothetical protein [Spirosoma arboris]
MPISQTNPENQAYQGVVDHLMGLYRGKISQRKAHEAARNLIGFCQLLLEIKSQNS